jgi:hypothetical protein
VNGATSPRLTSPRAGTPRLTTPGVIFLQSLFLFLAVAMDLLFSKSVGLFTGMTLLLVFSAGALLARPKARSWSAITPPLAVMLSMAVLMPILGTSDFSPARLSVDILNALAAIAPYLVLGAAVTWAYILMRARY